MARILSLGLWMTIKELGHFSLSELLAVEGPAGLHIRRDIAYKPMPLSELI